MELESIDRNAIIYETLKNIETAISRLQERTQNIKTVDDFLTSPSGMEKLDAACMVLLAIGKEAFSDCASVTKIVSKAQIPPTCGSQALDDINKWTCTLTVPTGCKDSYAAADQWKEFFFVEEGDGGGQQCSC